MSKGITYSCVDKDGNVYTRYSARHGAPAYFFASIARESGKAARKSGVSYASRQELAHRAHRGTYGLVGYSVEVVPVRAQAGRVQVDEAREREIAQKDREILGRR